MSEFNIRRSEADRKKIEEIPKKFNRSIIITNEGDLSNKNGNKNNKSIEDQIEDYKKLLSKIGSLNRKNRFKEIKTKYTPYPSDHRLLHRKLTKREAQAEHLAAQREDLREIATSLQILKQQVEKKPERGKFEHNTGERMRQLASFSWNKNHHTPEVDKQIKTALEYQEGLSSYIKKANRRLRRTEEKLGYSNNPYFRRAQRTEYILPEGCKILSGVKEAACGPTCLAMILSQYRPEYGKAEGLKKVVQAFKLGQVSENGGTFTKDFPEVLRRCGHPIFYTRDKLNSIDELRKKLPRDGSRDRHPVIAQVFEKGDPCAHVVVIDGIEKGKRIYEGKEYDVILYKVRDPYGGVAYKISEDDFREMWTGDTVFAEEKKTRPNVRPEKKPNVRPEKKPNVRPEKKPNVPPEQKPNVRPEQKPNVRPEQKPMLDHKKEPIVPPEQKPNVQHEEETIIEYEEELIVQHEEEQIVQHGKKQFIEHKEEPFVQHQEKPFFDQYKDQNIDNGEKEYNEMKEEEDEYSSWWGSMGKMDFAGISSPFSWMLPGQEIDDSIPVGGEDVFASRRDSNDPDESYYLDDQGYYPGASVYYF